MKGLRWLILLLLFCATVLNYVDRQSLSLLASTIQRAFRMTDMGYGHVVSCFLLSYTVMLALAGPLCDRLGVRKSMVAFICWWSLAELIPPFTRSVLVLGASRFLLGMGEAGVWVAAPKAVGEWFTVEKQALAIGLYTAGATIGAVIAPPLVTAFTSRYGWQSVFFVTGVAGLVWVIPWTALYRSAGPERLPSARSSTKSSIDLGPLLANGNLWLLMVVRMVTDPLWYFFLFWDPKYLSDVRHLSLARLGRVAWIVYLAADGLGAGRLGFGAPHSRWHASPSRAAHGHDGCGDSYTANSSGSVCRFAQSNDRLRVHRDIRSHGVDGHSRRSHTRPVSPAPDGYGLWSDRSRQRPGRNRLYGADRTLARRFRVSGSFLRYGAASSGGAFRGVSVARTESAAQQPFKLASGTGMSAGWRPPSDSACEEVGVLEEVTDGS